MRRSRRLGLVFPQARAAGWPPGMVERLRERAVAAAVWEDDHRQAVAEVIAALAACGIGTVLLKGTYAEPALRERGDTDLLIPETARDAADAAILALGFARATQVTGEHVSYQRSYCRRDRLGSEHVIDLHWRVCNAEVLSRLFPHEELAARAVPAAALGPAARATCPVDALMIACMHWEAHRDGTYWVDHEPHRVRERLIWLHDLHVLVCGMDQRKQDELVRSARRKALVAVCRDGLLQAVRCFGTPGAPNLVEQLRPPAGPELPYVYFQATTLGHLRDRSDAELVLRAYEAWGRACLARIDGDFALLVWDGRRAEAFCARDRMGIRPLHYHWAGDASPSRRSFTPSWPCPGFGRS